jgi:hypothetical protein
LYAQERTLFDLAEVITLHDLTNTDFDGTGKGNANASLGKSKEKRSDCLLVTLALVLDASGFAKRSEIFAGNISEPKTLAQMLGELASGPTDSAATVGLDAGIATAENIAWLVENGYRYLVVSRKRHREFDPGAAVLIKEDGDLRIRAQRRVNAETGEVELYCHSSQREKKAGHCLSCLPSASKMPLPSSPRAWTRRGPSSVTRMSWSARAACARRIHGLPNSTRSTSSRTRRAARPAQFIGSEPPPSPRPCPEFIACALADQLPVGGPIADTAIAAAIDQALQAIEGVAILGHPIGLDAPRDSREQMTGQVRNPNPGQDEKSRVVRHVGQVALTHRRRPTDPSIARATLEGRRAKQQAGQWLPVAAVHEILQVLL